MSFFKLDVSKCKRDGVCEKVCLAGIIKNDDNKVPFIDEAKAKFCIACGLCAAFCPHDACSTELLDESQFEHIDRSKLPSAESADMLLKSRRSVRQYKKQLVDEKEIKAIMNTIRYAPSAKNSQKARFIITKSDEDMAKIGDFVADYFEKICVELEKGDEDEKREATHIKAVAVAHRKGRDIILRGAPQLLICVMPKNYKWKMEDGSTALAYFEISAAAHGVGACWAGYFTTAARAYKPLQDFLGLKEGEFVVGGQMFGYPIYKTKRVPSRKKLDLTIL